MSKVSCLFMTEEKSILETVRQDAHERLEVCAAKGDRPVAVRESAVFAFFGYTSDDRLIPGGWHTPVFDHSLEEVHKER